LLTFLMLISSLLPFFFEKKVGKNATTKKVVIN
jgi:hypothetical protein